jgi:hypothetical protein
VGIYKAGQDGVVSGIYDFISLVSGVEIRGAGNGRNPFPMHRHCAISHITNAIALHRE